MKKNRAIEYYINFNHLDMETRSQVEEFAYIIE